MVLEPRKENDCQRLTESDAFFTSVQTRLGRESPPHHCIEHHVQNDLVRNASEGGNEGRTTVVQRLLAPEIFDDDSEGLSGLSNRPLSPAQGGGHNGCETGRLGLSVRFGS